MKRLLTAAAILGLVALMLPATTGIVLGQGDGSITFVKVISGDNKGPADLATFGLNYSDGVTTTTVVNNQVVTVPFGTYTAGENSLISEPGYSFISAVCVPGVGVNDGGANVATVTEGQPDWTCTITNSYSTPAQITFLKQFSTNAQGNALPTDFPMALTGNVTYPGQSGDTVAVTPGTYTLSEEQQPYYVAASGGCTETGVTAPNDGTNGLTYTFDPGTNWTCGFTNTWEPPLFQKVIGSGGTATLSDFTFIITQNGNQVAVVSGSALDTNGFYYAAPLDGTVLITEIPIVNYTASYDNAGYVRADHCGTLYADGWFAGITNHVPNLCVITNTYTPPVVQTTCGGTVTFSFLPQGYTLYIDTAAGLGIGVNGTAGPLSESVGTHTWQLSDDLHETIFASGSFTISPCYVPPPVITVSPSPSPSVSPSPSPSPSVSPSPVVTPRPSPKRTPNGGGVGGAGVTPPPTSALSATSTGSDSPLVPLSIALLLIAATGLVFVRRPKSR